MGAQRHGHRGEAQVTHWGALYEEVAPPPCEAGCAWRPVCARERLACLAFGHYVAGGRRTTRREGDEPTREKFDRVFPEKDGVLSGLDAERLVKAARTKSLARMERIETVKAALAQGMTDRRAANMAGIHVDTIRNWRRKGDLPPLAKRG